jgi:flagellar basal body-associated protein FliL
MKSSTKKILVIAIIVLFIVSIVAGALGGLL